MSDGRTGTTEARQEGFYWVVLGRNPPAVRRDGGAAGSPVRRAALSAAALMTHVLAAMVGIVMAAPALGATNPYDGAYSGERVLTNGATPFCAGQESVTVSITGSTLKFTNSEWRDLPMRFTPRPDGSFGGGFEDPSGHVVNVRGEATGTALDADVLNYGSGCEHHRHLTKNPA